MDICEMTPLRVVMVGHVDHGKSTVIGRLLHETGSLPPGKLDAVAAASSRRGMPFEWAFLLDALQLERDQGITVDVSEIRLRAPGRPITIVDAPGHVEFLRNMVTGAAAADAAVLVIDAAEGVRDQTRRHAGLLPLIGHRQVVVAVNKVDLIGFSAERFAALEAELATLLAGLNLTARAVVPVAARDGDNLVAASPRLGWYRGPTLLQALQDWPGPPAAENQPLRLAIQDVYKFDERRILAGRIESGQLAVGDALCFSPGERRSRIASIEAWPPGSAPRTAGAGMSVGLTLADPIFVERGEIASHEADLPVLTDVFHGRLFWLKPAGLGRGDRLTLRLCTQETVAVVEEILAVTDAARLEALGTDSVPANAIAEVVLRCRRVVALDDGRRLPRTGRFVLLDDDGAIAGGGIASPAGHEDLRRRLVRKADNLTEVASHVSAPERARRNGHAGGVLWLTGLSGSGKSTLAGELERRLFDRGYQVFVLDGDNLRSGLNADLGFSPEDRAENIRRAGAVAALMAQAGFICITAFISPYRSDRARARQACGAGFHEIYVQADLATCEARDPKGLYARARAGKIAEFTGISAPYEAPEAPELVVDTAAMGVEEAVDVLFKYAIERLGR
jgi:bifunctional enzyme CysN/CysC